MALDFSIVIPTRNRARTLKYCLQTCLKQQRFENYEIIVNDNGDDQKSHDLVREMMAEDDRARAKIKYFRRDSVCCMSDNFADAISKTSADYIIVLGDDDGLLPMALFEIKRLIDTTGAKAVKWSNGLYTWPDVEIENTSDYLGFSLQRNFNVKDSREELRRSIDELNYENLPMLYINSAIHKDVVAFLRDSDGLLFRSRAPDVYSSITIGYHCGSFVDVTVPFSLAGLSGASTGVAVALPGSNTRQATDFGSLNSNAGIGLHPHVPRLKIHPIIDFCDSFFFAKKYHFANDDRYAVSRRDVIARCVAYVAPTDRGAEKLVRDACADDDELLSLANDLLRSRKAAMQTQRLRPENLGADGKNIHLDGRDFGAKTIADAVEIVHKFVWPANASLLYEVQRALSD